MRLPVFLWFALALDLHALQLDVEKVFEDRKLGRVAELLAHGDYELVARVGEAAVERGFKAPEWRMMRFRALEELGQLETALTELEGVLKAFPGHFELLMLRHDLAKKAGKADLAADSLSQLNAAAKSKAAKDSTAASMVARARGARGLGGPVAGFFRSAFTHWWSGRAWGRKGAGWTMGRPAKHHSPTPRARRARRSAGWPRGQTGQRAS